MPYSLLLFLTLLATWAILSGFTSPLFIALALISCTLALWARMRMHVDEDSRISLAIICRAPAYALWLLKEIFVSSFSVAKIVWQPRLLLKPVFAWVPTAQRTTLTQTLFANSITLTPGTVTVVVRGNQLGVHALSQNGIDDLWEGEMDRRIVTCCKEGK